MQAQPAFPDSAVPKTNSRRLLGRFFVWLPLLTLTLLTTGCKKDDDKSDDPTPAASAGREVKYEVTGNYTGTFTIVYSNASGGFETLEDVRLPWSKTVTLDAGNNTAAFNAGATMRTPGVPGQTATARIYTNGTERGNSTGTANSDGYIVSLSPPGVSL